MFHPIRRARNQARGLGLDWSAVGLANTGDKMKHSIITALVVAFVAALTPHPTLAQPTGWYIGLGGG